MTSEGFTKIGSGHFSNLCSLGETSDVSLGCPKETGDFQTSTFVSTNKKSHQDFHPGGSIDSLRGLTPSSATARKNQAGSRKDKG